MSNLKFCYAGLPKAGKHITDWHYNDGKPNIDQVETLGNWKKLTVFEKLQKWFDEYGKEYAYEFCIYKYSDGTEKVGHISQKISPNGGNPYNNKKHSLDNWDNFCKVDVETTEILSFGCILRSSRHPSVKDITKPNAVGNQILTCFDASMLLSASDEPTDFCNKLSKTELKDFHILINKESKIQTKIIKEIFPSSKFIEYNKIEDIGEVLEKEEMKHLVTDKKIVLENIIITELPE